MTKDTLLPKVRGSPLAIALLIASFVIFSEKSGAIEEGNDRTDPILHESALVPTSDLISGRVRLLQLYSAGGKKVGENTLDCQCNSRADFVISYLFDIVESSY